jgi:hypothetical protein
MAADVSLPSVVLFFEGTGTLEVFQKIVSGLQRGGRSVHVCRLSGRHVSNERHVVNALPRLSETT